LSVLGRSVIAKRTFASSASKCLKKSWKSGGLKMAQKVCLVVIDGWGISEQKEGNAILNANTPVMDGLSASAGQAVTLDASGLSVGLPAGLMGNSEVGHMNIGAGRVVYQDIVQINMSVDDKSIQKNPCFVESCNKAKSSNGRLHLLGLVSDGGVHAHINHLMCLLEGAKINGVPKTFIHFFCRWSRYQSNKWSEICPPAIGTYCGNSIWLSRNYNRTILCHGPR